LITATNDKKGKAGGRTPAVPPAYQPRTSGRSVQAKAAPTSRRTTTAPPVFNAQGSQRPRLPRAASGRAAQAKMTGTIQMTPCPKCAQADLVAEEFCLKCGYNVRDEIRRGGHQMTIMPGYPGDVPVNEITHIGNKKV
jgi:hypothetical protein